eukprot:COSAG06_NODE_26373_length_616_cov_1.075435_1_plen_70_part_10
MRHYFRHTVRSTQGRVYGSAFTPYDFRRQPEQLVIFSKPIHRHLHRFVPTDSSIARPLHLDSVKVSVLEY